MFCVKSLPIPPLLLNLEYIINLSIKGAMLGTQRLFHWHVSWHAKSAQFRRKHTGMLIIDFDGKRL